MAVMRTCTILPATRRYNPTLYVSVPRLFGPPQTVRLALSGTPDPKTSTTINLGRIATVTKKTIPMTAKLPRPVVSFVRTPNPKTCLPLPTPQEAKRMYYVYHPTWTMIGPFPVVTFGSLRVVYLLPGQAAHYLGCYWIGEIPWHLKSWTARKFVKQMTGWIIVSDLPPVVNTPLVDQNGTEETPLTPYQFSATAFWDPDDHSQTLTYTATLSSGAALPAWLTFTPATRTFSGTPADGSVGVYTVRVRATDPWGQSVTDDFTLTIAAN